jgi:hypothetical protein
VEVIIIMRLYPIALAFASLPLLFACSTTNNDVGALGADSGDTAGAASSGGAATGTGGTVGSGGASVTTPTGGTLSSSGGASGGPADVAQDSPAAPLGFTVAGCKADTCGAEARLCGWGTSDAKYLGCLADCEILGVASTRCPDKAAALYGCASLGAKVDCTTGKGTGCDAEEAQARACVLIDGGADAPMSTSQHPYSGSGACFNTPITSYRRFPYDPSVRGVGGWPTCPINCNAIMATAGTIQAPLDQALPDGPCDDEGATCDSPLMAGWSAPCANTGGPGNGYTCTCRAKQWQCALVSQGMNMADPPRCLDPTLTIPYPASCSQVTWSATQVCGCGTCRDLCSSDADCRSGHCNPNQVCHATGTCAGPDDCPAPCTGLCAPVVTDGALPLKGVGGSCDIQVDAGASQGVYRTHASECASGLCLKPIAASSVGSVDTTAFCTAECSTDDDCAGGLNRDPKNPNDKTCKSGYTCGISFVKGALCCKKLCVCKDFTGGAIATPTSCLNQNDVLCDGTCLLGNGRQAGFGAVYSNGCSCCECGGGCQAIACDHPGTDAGDDTTPCHSDADCQARGWTGGCVFDQGCAQPQGLCMQAPNCGLGAIRTYCGCDGQSFDIVGTGRGPGRPYAHPGACP